jgi:hypothetical protein
MPINMDELEGVDVRKRAKNRRSDVSLNIQSYDPSEKAGHLCFGIYGLIRLYSHSFTDALFQVDGIVSLVSLYFRFLDSFSHVR